MVRSSAKNLKVMKKINSKSMSSVAFFNILGPVILNGINFFTVPLFTRLLGSENYGMYSLYVSWVSIITIAISLQTQGTISTASVHFGQKEKVSYLSSIVTLSLLSFLMQSAIVIIFIRPISNLIGMNYFVIMLILLQGFFGYCINAATAYFTFNKDSYKTLIISVVNAISSVVISLIFIRQIKNTHGLYMGRVLGSALPTMIIGFILLIGILSRGRTFYSKAYWKYCLALCLPLVLHSLSGIVLAQIDRLMIKSIIGSASEVGVYSFAYTLANILSIIWSALNNTWIPFYYEFIGNKDDKLIMTKSKNYLQLFTIITIGFIFLSPEVIRVCGSEEFLSAIELMPILAIGMFMVFLYSFPVNYEFYHEKSAYIAIGTTSAAICNIILNYLFIPHWGMYGAAMATVISYVLLFVFHQIICMKIVKNGYHYPVKIFVPYCLMVGISTVVFYLLKDFWMPRWILGIVLGVCLLRRIVKNKSIF